MKQYIDKADVVAEIKKRMQELRPVNTHKMRVGEMDRDVLMWLNALTWVKGFLNTLEVKEVDLNKEARHYLLHEHKSPLLAVFHQTDLHSEMQYHEDIENAFKAGFELGIKAKENLEVKEVDLEKEIELIKGDYEQVDVAWNNDFDFIAKHFFEIGLKAMKGGEE